MLQSVRKRCKPLPTVDEVTDVFLTHWAGLLGDVTVEDAPARGVVRVKAIDSYDDANFHVTLSTSRDTEDDKVGEDNESQYLVKFHNAMETTEPDILDGLSLMLDTLTHRLAAHCLVSTIQPPSSSPVCVNSKDYVFREGCLLADGTTATVAVRVFAWIRGETLTSCLSSLRDTLPSEEQCHAVYSSLFEQVGELVSALSVALRDTDHASFHRKQLWDLAQFSLALPLLSLLEEEMPLDTVLCAAIRRTAEEYERLFFAEQGERLSDTLPRSLIMGDCNDANIIVDSAARRVVGLIDFSDAIWTWSVNELAIAVAYGLISAANERCYSLVVNAILRGALPRRPLSVEELRALPVLIAVRLSTSVMVGAFSIKQEPDNEYLRLHALPARESLKYWTSTSFDEHTEFFSKFQANLLA